MKALALRVSTALAYWLIALLLAGCASVALSASTFDLAAEAPGAPPTPERAGAIAINALQAWNTGDYAGWTRDWSAALKESVHAGDFEVFRDRTFDRYGSCFAITHTGFTPSPRAGFTRWAFDVECRSGRLRFTFAFADGSEQVESVYVEPLR